MQKRQKLRAAMGNAMEVPMELIYKEPVITIVGHCFVRVENYKSILRYTKEEILVSTLHGVLKICGKCLSIQYYSCEDMKINGNILGIFMESR